MVGGLNWQSVILQQPSKLCSHGLLVILKYKLWIRDHIRSLPKEAKSNLFSVICIMSLWNSPAQNTVKAEGLRKFENSRTISHLWPLNSAARMGPYHTIWTRKTKPLSAGIRTFTWGQSSFSLASSKHVLLALGTDSVLGKMVLRHQGHRSGNIWDGPLCIQKGPGSKDWNYPQEALRITECHPNIFPWIEKESNPFSPWPKFERHPDVMSSAK